MPPATQRRHLIADAAIATLSQAGLRGLTHRAVDRQAGLAEGSTSYYLRTRQALLTATLDRLLELDQTDLAKIPEPDTITTMSEAADALGQLLHGWVTTGRSRMLARYELALEATRNPQLSKALTASGTKLREHAQALLSGLGVRTPETEARLLAAYLDGLMFDHLAGAGALTLTEEQWRDAIHILLQTLVNP